MISDSARGVHCFHRLLQRVVREPFRTWPGISSSFLLSQCVRLIHIYISLADYVYQFIVLIAVIALAEVGAGLWCHFGSNKIIDDLPKYWNRSTDDFLYYIQDKVGLIFSSPLLVSVYLPVLVATCRGCVCACFPWIRQFLQVYNAVLTYFQLHCCNFTIDTTRIVLPCNYTKLCGPMLEHNLHVTFTVLMWGSFGFCGVMVWLFFFFV